MTTEKKSHCFIDSNIFLRILWKEPAYKESNNCLNCSELNCCTGDVTKAITIYKFLSIIGKFKDEISIVDNLEEIKKIVNDNYKDKGLIDEYVEEIELLIDDGLDVETSVNISFFDKVEPILRKQLRSLFFKAYTIRTNINWSYFSGLDNLRTSFFIPQLHSLYGKEEFIDQTQKNLIKKRLTPLNTCLRDNEDAINYSIAITTMNDYFITCDEEFFNGSTILCISKSGLRYIAERPKTILEIVT